MWVCGRICALNVCNCCETIRRAVVVAGKPVNERKRTCFSDCFTVLLNKHSHELFWVEAQINTVERASVCKDRLQELSMVHLTPPHYTLSQNARCNNQILNTTYRTVL